MSKQVEVFVPGRLCLLGEHSDWAAEYRQENKLIEKGYAIVAGIDLGIYLKGWESDGFSYCFGEKTICLNMESLKVANCDPFFGYVISAANIMYEQFEVKGARIVCENMTLPVKKGLASSAAICVGIVRIFNMLYELNLSIEDEMLLAYRAEVFAGSRCGKMDQVCAYGQGLRKITFDENGIKVDVIRSKHKLCFILVDLNGKKDTKKILNDLNSIFPFPRNEKEEKLFSALGQRNKELVELLERSITDGDIGSIGKALCSFQKMFDENVACFSGELESPLLHELISYVDNLENVVACKGVGSQGDGMAQILIDSEIHVNKIIRSIQDKFGFQCYELTIGKDSLNAIVPIDGKETRITINPLLHMDLKIMNELDELYETIKIIKGESNQEQTKIPIFSFEGLPGAGKTTQIKLISDKLAKKYGKVSYIDLPTKSAIGKILKTLYSDEQRWNMIRKEAPWLNPIMISADLRIAMEYAKEDGAKYAFMSRGILSTYYYNLDAFADDDSEAWRLMEEYMTAFYRPTAIIFMDLPENVAYERVVKRNRGPLRKMDEIEEMRKDKKRLLSFLNNIPEIPVYFIDAVGSEDEVTERIIKKLKGYLT